MWSNTITAQSSDLKGKEFNLMLLCYLLITNVKVGTGVIFVHVVLFFSEHDKSVRNEGCFPLPVHNVHAF